MTGPAELLVDCHARGIRLLPAGDGDLTIDAPKGALTPALVARLRAHKAELLTLLRSPAAVPAAPFDATGGPPVAPKPVCQCGSTTWQDVPIHGGRSLRRDCGRCGRFIAFTVWHGPTRDPEHTVRGGH